jgi:hypothetical protein
MITSLLVRVEVGIEIVREEKEPEDGKHDEELDDNDKPQAFSERTEIPEALVVEIKYPDKDVFLHSFCLGKPKIHINRY